MVIVGLLVIERGDLVAINHQSAITNQQRIEDQESSNHKFF